MGETSGWSDLERRTMAHDIVDYKGQGKRWEGIVSCDGGAAAERPKGLMISVKICRPCPEKWGIFFDLFLLHMRCQELFPRNATSEGAGSGPSHSCWAERKHWYSEVGTHMETSKPWLEKMRRSAEDCSMPTTHHTAINMRLRWRRSWLVCVSSHICSWFFCRWKQGDNLSSMKALDERKLLPPSSEKKKRNHLWKPNTALLNMFFPCSWEMQFGNISYIYRLHAMGFGVKLSIKILRNIYLLYETINVLEGIDTMVD